MLPYGAISQGWHSTRQPLGTFELPSELGIDYIV